MSFLRPKAVTLPSPPPPPPPPTADKADTQRAAALAEEAVSQARKRRGRGSTIVAGALGDQQGVMGGTGGKPTLLG